MQTCHSQAESEYGQLESNKCPVCSLAFPFKISKATKIDILGKHEFTSSNSTQMKPDGSLLPSTNKSSRIHELKNMVTESEMCQTFTGVESTTKHGLTTIIMDGMAPVQEMIVLSTKETKANLVFYLAQ